MTGCTSDRSRYIYYSHAVGVDCVTPWSPVHLEKPPVAQPLDKLPTFYGNQMFISVFTKARH
jgi:hypothetical protein